jgi:hypothetical protein
MRLINQSDLHQINGGQDLAGGLCAYYLIQYQNAYFDKLNLDYQGVTNIDNQGPYPTNQESEEMEFYCGKVNAYCDYSIQQHFGDYAY